MQGSSLDVTVWEDMCKCSQAFFASTLLRNVLGCTPSSLLQTECCTVVITQACCRNVCAKARLSNSDLCDVIVGLCLCTVPIMPLCIALWFLFFSDIHPKVPRQMILFGSVWSHLLDCLHPEDIGHGVQWIGLV